MDGMHWIILNTCWQSSVQFSTNGEATTAAALSEMRISLNKDMTRPHLSRFTSSSSDLSVTLEGINGVASNGATLLSDVNISSESGTMTGLAGRSRSGKSTFLRALSLSIQNSASSAFSPQSFVHCILSFHLLLLFLLNFQQVASCLLVSDGFSCFPLIFGQSLAQ
jgi:ABC-type transport system involved in cytochrome bd biosynthesis fused ATPase/permease subunit